MKQDQRTPLSDTQADAITEDLQALLMWRTSRLAELEGVLQSVDGDGDTRRSVMADLAANERAIAEIRNSLDRLSERTYGRCVGCGTPIPFERLKIRPLTRHCMPCRRQHEAA
ncbi:TraR/DksA family transcriptional regulator [Nonomuraea sp. NPDC059194]|uniref:TraR/DksA family transcriptional regulator n=1 Tax=Nonomuraea sp. NPDC059194 TaxID=3346764 RepID=UPI0036C41448